MKAAGSTMASRTKAQLELKQRVFTSLNRLADRDTYQLAADDLHRAAQSLSPDSISSFLSCISTADTDAADRKPPVRRECVRLVGSLARSHGHLLAPHLPRILSSVLLKRLKDTDSLVRESCVDAVAALAAYVPDAFVTLAQPLFEALGEQNRYVQDGAALCLAKLIDQLISTNGYDPPTLSAMSLMLPQMLTKVTKLLKNPHFMAKPAIIELIRSIVQAAASSSSDYALSAAVNGVLEALKSSDWTTRKAASSALANMAAVAPCFLLEPLKRTCLRSLESCRFDKVKPVRDSVLYAIQCWKTLPESDTPEPSEAGSTTTKENMVGEYSVATSGSNGGRKDELFTKNGSDSVLSCTSTILTRKKVPLAAQRGSSRQLQKNHHTKSNDWDVEISFPKSCSEGSCILQTYESTIKAKREQEIKYGYEIMDDKPDCSSVSDIVSGYFDIKHVTVSHSCLEKGEENSKDITAMKDRPLGQVAHPDEGHQFRERKSVDSIVTDMNSCAMHECCLQATNELASIKEQLLDIQTNQSNLLELLQVFMRNSNNDLRGLQIKLCNLEQIIEKKPEGTTQSNYSITSQFLRKNHSVSSTPRVSTCTPRPSVDVNYKHPSLLSLKNMETLAERASPRSRSNTSTKDTDSWKDRASNLIRNPITKGVEKHSGRVQNTRGSLAKGNKDALSGPDFKICSKEVDIEGRAALWKRIRGFLCYGDLESAYTEIIACGDDLGLIELMDKTGPVLQRLSHATADEILDIMAMHFPNQRFLGSLIPWLKQVVELSTSEEARHIFLSMRARSGFLAAIQKASTLEFPDPEVRISIRQLASKLTRIWLGSPGRYAQPLPPEISA